MNGCDPDVSRFEHILDDAGKRAEDTDTFDAVLSTDKWVCPLKFLEYRASPFRFRVWLDELGRDRPYTAVLHKSVLNPPV